MKTREGWLLVYHGIATHFAGACIYQAGVGAPRPRGPVEACWRGAATTSWSRASRRRRPARCRTSSSRPGWSSTSYDEDGLRGAGEPGRGLLRRGRHVPSAWPRARSKVSSRAVTEELAVDPSGNRQLELEYACHHGTESIRRLPHPLGPRVVSHRSTSFRVNLVARGRGCARRPGERRGVRALPARRPGGGPRGLPRGAPGGR